MPRSHLEQAQDLLLTRAQGVALYQKIISKEPKLYSKQLKSTKVNIKPQPNPGDFKSYEFTIDDDAIMDMQYRTDITKRKEKADRILKYHEIKDELNARKE